MSALTAGSSNCLLRYSTTPGPVLMTPTAAAAAAEKRTHSQPAFHLILFFPPSSSSLSSSSHGYPPQQQLIRICESLLPFVHRQTQASSSWAKTLAATNNSLLKFSFSPAPGSPLLPFDFSLLLWLLPAFFSFVLFFPSSHSFSNYCLT